MDEYRNSLNQRVVNYCLVVTGIAFVVATGTVLWGGPSASRMAAGAILLMGWQLMAVVAAASSS